jgi:hypothetical protein
MTLLTTRPQIDYTDKDYDSLRLALLRFAELRIPEWTDRNPADIGMLMLDLFAYVGDTVLYYQDRMANEFFLDTAVERASIVSHLGLIGYDLAPAAPASTELDLTFDAGPASVTILTGTQFRTVGIQPAQIFEFLEPDLVIQLDSDQVEPDAAGRLVYRRLPVRQGRSMAPQVIGSATNEANQSFALGTGAVIGETVAVEVDEGAGWVRWDRRDALLFDIGPDGRIRMSTPDARHYVVRYDGNGRAFVQFGGDGRFGMRPPVGTNNIRASFVEGGGAAGNVAANTIREALTPIPGLRTVTNPQAAVGGQDGQSEVEAARIGPAAFRARERAVTLEDYEAMALLAGGIAKTRARAASWNRVDVHVGAAGPQLAPLSETLRRRLMAFLDERKMAGTDVRILDAVAVPINVTVDVYYDERYRPDAVRQAAQEAILSLLAYDRVDFGQPVYLGAMHDALLRVAGVRGANISLFNRADGAGDNVDALLASASLPPLESLPLALQTALSRRVEADGRIEIAPEEIAVPGTIQVTIAVGVA